jgi:uncharacterized membrane protein YgcG
VSVAGDTTPGQPHRRSRWLTFAVVVVVVLAAGTALWAADPFATRSPAKAGVTDNAYPTSLATTVRRDLSAQTELSGTLGYVGSYTVAYQGGGSAGSAGSGSSNSGAGSSDTFTWLPAVGQVIRQGRPLYDVNGTPVVLLRGSTPVYRSLSEDLTGGDVAELNTDLVVLGYVTSAEIPAGSDTFTWWTKYGVEKLQAALGVTQTGTLTLGQAVFLPTAALVSSLTASLGGPAQAGSTVLAATSTTRQVSIALDPAQQSEVAVGDKVGIVLPNNQTIAGVISSVGTVATTSSSGGNGGSGSGGDDSPGSSSDNGSGGGSGSTPTITVLVRPTEAPPTRSWWDQASVNVTVTTATAHNALVVPVDALVALASGGYAVEVVEADGIHKLVPVSLGMFDDADGLVQITSPGLAAGEKVVVPAL